MSKSACKCKKPECEECPEWIFTFADLVMLMMGFFVILWVLKPAPGKAGDQDQVLPMDLLIAIREAFDHLPDPNALDVEARLEEEQARMVILRTLDQLPEQERLVVALYYYEHMTLNEIGRALGISESRVSQVHSRATTRLRMRLHKTLYGEMAA